MQELIDQLKEKAGLTADQATNAINAIKDYVKEKFPMLEGAVENMFGQKDLAGDASGSTASDFIKNASDKAEEALDGLKDKFSGMFSDNK